MVAPPKLDVATPLLWTAAALALLAQAASCGTEVDTTASAGSAAASGAGGAGGAGSSTSSGGAPGCGHTNDRFRASLATPDGMVFECVPGTQTEPTEISLQGKVIDATPDSIVIDTCGPADDCPMLLATLSVDATMLSAAGTPVGAYIDVTYTLDPAWIGCIHKVVVKNLPVWQGDPNPVSGDDRLWLAGQDGYESGGAKGLFTVTHKALGCYPDDPSDCGGGPREDYQWHVTSPQAPDGVDVSMGSSVQVPMGDALMEVRNLRSFTSGYCDDYWSWAYWIAPVPPYI